jgi:hypothetical protein
MPSTTLENLYDVLCEVVTRTTGYAAWSKGGIQATPAGNYATVYLQDGEPPATQDVVETSILDEPGLNGETLREHPWNQVYLTCVAEFFRGDAMTAANQLRSGLQLSNREFDLWPIAGLAGPVRVIDMSTIFRADTEPRAQLRFHLHANLVEPLPLDANIFEIHQQPIPIKHVPEGYPQDQFETIEVTVTGG